MERDASAVLGKVTSARPGSSRDTLRLRCAREVNSAPLPSAATRPLLLLPKTSSTRGGMQQPPLVTSPSPAEGHPGLVPLQPLCALPAGDLPLILSFNLPDFIFRPSVLIIPLSAKLKSPLIPGTFLPGKVLAPCNQVTSQATFR